MSVEPRCIVEVIESSNSEDYAVPEALALVKPALDAELTGQLACEKCGATFDVSTELGTSNAQLKLSTGPSNEAEACPSARYRRPGDWVTNLNKRWFNPGVLGFPDDVGEERGQPFSLSLAGLEIVLVDTTEKLQRVQAGRANELMGTGAAAQAEIETVVALKILGLLVERDDGKSWKQVLEDRISGKLPA